MNPMNPSPRDELAEPLRTIISGIASEPVPEELMQSARKFRAPVSRRDAPTPRSLSAVLASLLALGICVMALIFREKPQDPKRKIVKESQSALIDPSEELPPPSLWAYRQAARTPEALDALLTHHAAVLLPSGEDVSLHPFSRKEEL